MGARASTSWRRWTSRWPGWGWTTSTFYSHRFDPETPLEETMTALDHAVRSGRALYVGISSYSPSKTREAATIARELGTPLLIHQPSYSMFNRWIEGLLDELEAQGHGLHRVHGAGPGPADQPLPCRRARRLAGRPGRLDGHALDDQVLERVRALNDIATGRGQQLAQLALRWALFPQMTSLVIGASSVEQLDTNLDARWRSRRSPRRLARAIDAYAVESGVNLWADATYDEDPS
ncbi:MAG: aldo/keto reductase [Nocardioides sp.]